MCKGKSLIKETFSMITFNVITNYMLTDITGNYDYLSV